MSLQNNVLKLILSDARTVFPIQSMVMLSGISDGVRLTKMLNYYVKKGDILNPRRGIYTKPNYNAEELACAIFHPSYISLEYVLKQAGVIFQYDSTITSVSYLSRSHFAKSNLSYGWVFQASHNKETFVKPHPKERFWTCSI